VEKFKIIGQIAVWFMASIFVVLLSWTAWNSFFSDYLGWKELTLEELCSLWYLVFCVVGLILLIVELSRERNE
jgi:hypothetical protein